MKLAMIHYIWKEMETKGPALRKYHFAADHFELDSYKKMRVFLAVQVLSQTTINMITEYCQQDNNEATIDEYQGMIDLFAKINRLVDICNAKGGDQITKSKKRRDVEKINHPKHKHIFELFDVLREFEKWKKECGGLNKKFITRQTYEDLKWLVFGIASVAGLYLKEDKSLVMDQGRLGSDTCEHFFAMIRDGNPNPDPHQADQQASHVSSTNAIMNANLFQNKRQSNAIGAGSDKQAYVAPIPRKDKRHKTS